MQLILDCCLTHSLTLKMESVRQSNDTEPRGIPPREGALAMGAASPTPPEHYHVSVETFHGFQTTARGPLIVQISDYPCRKVETFDVFPAVNVANFWMTP
jgi:hypothetical protein